MFEEKWNPSKENSQSYNCFRALSVVKIFDFGEKFTAWFSICILGVPRHFLGRKILRKFFFCWNCNWILIEKVFRPFGKNNFCIVFQTEFHMSRETFRRKTFCWLQIFEKIFRNLTVSVKKIGNVVKTAFYVSRRTFKIVFFITSSVLFTPWLWAKLFQKVDKKHAKLGESALYVSRRTKWGKTNWKNIFFLNFSYYFFWNFSLGASKLDFTCLDDVFQGNCSLK